MTSCVGGRATRRKRLSSWSTALLLAVSSLGSGCAQNTPLIAQTNAVAPTASLSAGSRQLRARDGMTMLYVPEGRFKMGSDYLETNYARKLCREYIVRDTIAACKADNFRDESPAHDVMLAAFWIDQTEVSNEQYLRCENASVCKPPVQSNSHFHPSYYGNPEYADYPVLFVTRAQAAAYCHWVGGRLPTEAEWEYAARGPNSSIFPWGDAFDGTRLNYCDVNCDAGPSDPTIDDGYADTAPVGSFPSGASWIGALDMAGNVREWVADWYGPYPSQAQIDPTGPARGDLIVPRGGSWIDNPSIVRGANRGGNTEDYYRDYYGFRCAVK
jgi:formylglycine-generating enzyme required for sulfatase activity